MKYDCIILGAGMSGLAAGIRLAHFGKKVLIIEKHSKIGGLNSYYHRKGIEIDSGLHAMTNFSERGGSKRSPLLKLLRQLRIPYEELNLREQNHSIIRFDTCSLRFSNDFRLFESEIADKFPSEIDSFRLLCRRIDECDDLNMDAPFVSARGLVKDLIRDETLAEMIFCPLMYYGSAVEGDMDFAQFSIMFKSIFKEGFCKPEGGVRQLLSILEDRFVSSGGELKLSSEVSKIVLRDGKLAGIETADGRFIESEFVLSSAGSIETLSLCDPRPANKKLEKGNLSFVEAIFCFPSSAKSFPAENFSIMFFNRGDSFKYSNPHSLFSFDSGVVCLPQNFKYSHPPAHKMLRMTLLSDAPSWRRLEMDEYLKTKRNLSALVLAEARRIFGKAEILSEDEIILEDLFTPLSVERYTGHIDGAIYGSPTKLKDGLSGVENLFICGTDQGFLGISGAMLSGISIANKYLLK